MKKILFFFLFLSFTIQAKIIYVDKTAIGINNGASWNDAYIDLQSAIQNVTNGDSIFVAQGEYLPTNTTVRSKSFNLLNSVVIFGGFKGGSDNAFQRDFKKYATILSGNIGTKDSTDNCYNVIKIISKNIKIDIDGIVITDGNANFSSSVNPNDYQGGGVYIRSDTTASVHFSNCNIISNTSTSYGGGVVVSSSNGISFPDVTFSDCNFENNRSFIGGAINFAGVRNSNKILLSRCNFRKNYARNAGAVDIDDSGFGVTIRILKCNFTENQIINGSGGGGAGLRLTQYSPYTKVLIDSTNFVQNIANEEGGGLIIYSTTFASVNLKITNSKFNNNKAIEGSQISIQQQSSEVKKVPEPKMEIFNCSFIDNKNKDNYQLSIESISTKIANCIFVSQSSNFIKLYNTAEKTPMSLYNNLFQAVNENELIYFYSFQPYDVTLSNNIFMQKKLNVVASNNSVAMTVKVNNNMYVSKNIDSLNLLKLPVGSLLNSSNNIFTNNPLFADTSKLDFHLLPCSPAINAGNNTYISGLLTDFDGKPRIAHQKIDIGPYEFQDFKTSNFLTKPSFCTSKEGSFLPILQGNCTNLPTITWKNTQNQTGNGNDKLSSGTYTFFIKDTNGCADTLKNIVIEDKGNISADFNIFNTSGTNAKNGSIAVTNVTNGKAPFKYIWSNGDTTKAVKNLAAGDYQVTISDANGCLFSTNLTVKAASATTDIFLENISATPNPTSDKITFRYDTAHFANDLFITFYDLQGKIILPKQKLNANEQIDVSYFASGLYFYQITDNQYLTIKKIIILH